MNVGQLIKELQEYPKGWRVGFTSHDNSEDEVQGMVRCVRQLEEGRDTKLYGKNVVVLAP